MRNNSFRTRFTTGAFTLPLVAGLVTVLWVLPGISDLNLWLGWAAVGLTTFMLAELNNRNALIRVRSRMVGATFLGLYLACPALHSWSTAMIPMLCLPLSYFQLFATYQKPHPEGNVFLGYLFLGIASWFYPPLLLCAAVLYFCLLIPLRALTWRTGFAGIFGLLLPYWFHLGWAIWSEQLDTAFLPFVEAFRFEATDFSVMPTSVFSWCCLTICLVLCSILHFSHTAYNDKIRTRMFYYVIISVEIFVVSALLLQPQAYQMLSNLLIVNGALLIAHYFTLGKGRVLDYWFIVVLSLWIILTIFNTLDLWTLLSISL